MTQDRSSPPWQVGVALVVGLLPGYVPAAELGPVTRTYVSYDQPAIAITHVRVIDGTGAPAREDQQILLRDGKIVALGRHLDLPKDVTVIDGTGKSLIPGLVGMHDHMFYPAPRVNPASKELIAPEQASSFPKLYLAGGALSFEQGRMGVDQFLARRPPG